MSDRLCSGVSSEGTHGARRSEVRALRTIVSLGADLSVLRRVDYRVLRIGSSVAKVPGRARLARHILQGGVGPLRAALARVNVAVLCWHYRVACAAELGDLAALLADEAGSASDRPLSPSRAVVVHGTDGCLVVVVGVAVVAARAGRVELRALGAIRSTTASLWLDSTLGTVIAWRTSSTISCLPCASDVLECACRAVSRAESPRRTVLPHRTRIELVV